MGAKALIHRLLAACGYSLQRLPATPGAAGAFAEPAAQDAAGAAGPAGEAVEEEAGAVDEEGQQAPTPSLQDPYDEDGLRSYHNHAFMQDERFCRAYARGCQAAADYGWHWRVHIGLWAAFTASKLEGDFIECGVNRGFLSSAIMDYLDWDSSGKTFYLLDTFEGLDPRYCSEADIKAGAIEKNKASLASGFYVENIDSVRQNFSQWHNIQIIQGSIPDTLPEVTCARIAFLHIDMNCSPPEIAAIEHFWDRLVDGAIILLDDYAYFGFEPQKLAMDAFAAARQLQIASLPTGQGLLLKPPAQP